MRERLLELLVCPSCGRELTLNATLHKGAEIFEGTLSCDGSHNFPIIRGVPRFLLKDLQHQLTPLYPDFFERHRNLLKRSNEGNRHAPSGKKEETVDRFGYEWTYFSDYQCDNFSIFISPLPKDFFAGKLGLDVGCGAGRYARQAAEMGAGVVAADISPAVDSAYDHNMDNASVHVVQADIYSLPFRPDAFQFIYGLGVIHHLPTPESGFQGLNPFLRSNGALFIWLYAYAHRKVALEVLRAISQRLSNANIRRMAFLFNLLDYGIIANSYRFLSKSAVLGGLAERLFPQRVKEYSAHGYRVAYADWFDRLSAPIANYYKKEELIQWLARSGLHNTKLLPVDDSWWWLYGESK